MPHDIKHGYTLSKRAAVPMPTQLFAWKMKVTLILWLKYAQKLTDLENQFSSDYFKHYILAA